MQGVHEAVAFLLAPPARAARATKLDPRRPRRLARGDASLRLAAAGACSTRSNDALAAARRPARRRGPHGLDADDRPRARARRRAGGGVPGLRRRRGVPRPPAGAAARAAARALRRRARALQGASTRSSPRGGSRAPRVPGCGRCTSSATGRCATVAERARRRAAGSRRSGRTRLDAGRCRAALDDVLARLPAVALGGAARASSSRRSAAAARSSAATAPASPTSSTTARTGCSSTPSDPDALADALVRVLSDRALAERLGAAARADGRGAGRRRPAEYAASGRSGRRRSLAG